MDLENNIPENWIETTLVKVGKLGRGKSKHRPRWAPHLYGGKYPFIQTGEIKSASKFIESYIQTYSEEGLTQSKLWDKNTLCITIAANIAEIAILKFPACFPDSVLGFIPNKAECDIDFIFYNFTMVQAELRQLAIGSVQDNINLGTFENLQFLLPPLQEQKAIANILTAFDDKIELLQQQNTTLETIAQTIFKEWFGKYQVGDELPDGWRVGKFGDIINIFDSKRVPLSKTQREDMKGDYRYYGATSIMDFVNDFIFDGIYLLFAEDGSVIDNNGHPFLQYVWGKFWVNNHTHILQGKNGFSTELLYVLCKKMRVAGIVNGAVQLKINQGNLLGMETVIPNEGMVKKIDAVIQSLFKKLRTNSDQIESLTKTRDTLLPKLMSGQVRVKM